MLRVRVIPETMRDYLTGLNVEIYDFKKFKEVRLHIVFDRCVKLGDRIYFINDTAENIRRNIIEILDNVVETMGLKIDYKVWLKNNKENIGIYVNDLLLYVRSVDEIKWWYVRIIEEIISNLLLASDRNKNKEKKMRKITVKKMEVMKVNNHIIGMVVELTDGDKNTPQEIKVNLQPFKLEERFFKTSVEFGISTSNIKFILDSCFQTINDFNSVIGRIGLPITVEIKSCSEASINNSEPFSWKCLEIGDRFKYPLNIVINDFYKILKEVIEDIINDIKIEKEVVEF